MIHRLFLNRRTTVLAVGIGMLWLVGICLSFVEKGGSDFEKAKLEIVLRRVGHEILLLTGDRNTPLLPVKQVGAHEFRLTFQRDFAFEPDSLVRVIGSVFKAHDISSNYVVRIFNCDEQKMIFGYAILGSEKNDIVPCRGRLQPKNCYQINIKFEGERLSGTQMGYLLGGIPLLIVIGLISMKRVKPYREEKDGILSFGKTTFDPEKRVITFLGSTTELTPKESHLLLIFAQSPDHIIERVQLQKLLWEDEGVIVGRSLDVFISKLRKKLEQDDSIALVNIHGKGYKLRISG